MPKTYDEFIERIEAAVAEIDKITKDRRWISVEERLPELGQQVLAAIPPRDWNEENPAIIRTLDYEQRGFYSWEDDEWHARVSHWLPMPLPPEPPPPR